MVDSVSLLLHPSGVIWFSHFSSFAISGHLLVSLGTGAFVRLEFLALISNAMVFKNISIIRFSKETQWFWKKSETLFCQKKTL